MPEKFPAVPVKLFVIATLFYCLGYWLVKITSTHGDPKPRYTFHFRMTEAEHRAVIDQYHTDGILIDAKTLNAAADALGTLKRNAERQGGTWVDPESAVAVAQ